MGVVQCTELIQQEWKRKKMAGSKITSFQHNFWLNLLHQGLSQQNSNCTNIFLKALTLKHIEWES